MPTGTPLSRLSRTYKGYNVTRSQSTTEGPDKDGPMAPLRLGVCAMDKKARSKPMKEILARIMAFNEFEIVYFGDELILHQPVSEWPVCDCLMSWHSDGFPLAKAREYVALRRPFCVNDMAMQEVLLDRRRVYETLIENSIPLPHHIMVNRDHLEPGVTDPPGFVEDNDYVELGGVRINKPFVEKPVSGEDHNIYIYYPFSMGGGVKRLFRKVDNKSADYDPNHPGCVRRDGSYIYEEFLTTGGTDVKVYTVGPRYAHAEARKSPVVDGKVQRTADGKEVRFPVLLTPQEKEIARMVCLAFGQKVCGFDLLRSEKGRSYVCDVNGWSFVKNSRKYYDDAAGILRSIILSALAPHRLSTVPMLLPSAPSGVCDGDGYEGGSMKPVNSNVDLEGLEDMPDDENPEEELRCVLAVIRHGDRTPKQKMKMKVNQPSLLSLFEKHRDSKGKQAKLKSPQQLQELLDITRELLQQLDGQAAAQAREQQQASSTGSGGGAAADEASSSAVGGGAAAAAAKDGGSSKDEIDELREKLRIVRTVLEQGGQFSGINRKVQLKPIRWSVAPAPSGYATPLHPSTGGMGPGEAPALNAQLLSLANTSAGQSASSELRPTTPTYHAASSNGGAPPAPVLQSSAFATAFGPNRSSTGGGAVSAMDGGAGGPPRVEELMLILKWGGVLTHAGRQQAENLGSFFRTAMYPRYGPMGGGLLRLHSTYRHDLKIYSSDEGRVQASAAAFTKGLLDLEGTSLTPILVSLVNKDASMLDAFGKGASDDMRRAKDLLYQALTWDPEKNQSLYSPLPSTVPPSVPSPPRSPAPHGMGSVGGSEPNSLGNSLALPLSSAALKEILNSPKGLAGDVTPVPPSSSAVSALELARAMATGGQGSAGMDEALRNSADSDSLRLATAASGIGATSGSFSGPLPHPHPPLPLPALRFMPPHPLQLLHSMVARLKELVDQLRSMCVGEGRDAGPYKSYSSLSQAAEEWEEEPERPCSGERLLLMFDRWRKLLKSFYNEKKGQFDISKVPDIYDSVKHDAIHNAHLKLKNLGELYRLSKALADVVIPNEYGLDPHGKLNIGGKICKELLGKVLADLANMREESIVTAGIGESGAAGGPGGAEPEASGSEGGLPPGQSLPSYSFPSVDNVDIEFGAMSLQDEQMRTRKGRLAVSKPQQQQQGARPGGASPEAAVASLNPNDAQNPSGQPPAEGAEGDVAPEEAETLHRLCPTYASDINSPLRHVRTRIYFTSESHIHSLVNVLRFAHLREGSSAEPLLSPEAMAMLEDTPELDYLTHIVFRMYENNAVEVDSPLRFRVEISLSPGAAYNPIQPPPSASNHVLPVVPRVVINPGPMGLAGVEELLAPFSVAHKVSPSIYALQVALKAPSHPVSRLHSGHSSTANLGGASVLRSPSLTRGPAQYAGNGA